MSSKPKIGILTHFNSFQAGYALSVGWKERANLLSYFGQDYDFLVNTSCPEGLYPRQRNCLEVVSTKEPFNKRAKLFRKNYRKVLEPYDIILTADLIYQSKGNFLACNQAMRWANKDFKARGMKKHWFHWIHSAFSEHKKAEYPLSLRYTPMEDSTLVYMNTSELPGVASMYKVPVEEVACVYNPKDFRSFMNFHPAAWEVTRRMDIAHKDYVQLFPFCTTRCDAKGLKEVALVAAAIKRAGKSVALVLANSNANSGSFEIAHKDAWFSKLGLVEGKDYMWTSKMFEDGSPLPREAVANLFLISNYFVFGSYREVCPNVLLEAKITGNYLLVSQNCKPAVEFAGKGAHTFNATAKIPGKQDTDTGKEIVKKRNPEKYYDNLAQLVIENAPSRDHLWEFSFENIWHNQFKPLLYG